MSVIRVSGKNRGKINRVHGSSNYFASTTPIKKNIEETYYTQMIKTTKNYVHSNNYKKYIKKIRIYGNRLSEKTLIKILKAYQDTLLVGKNLNTQLRAEYISNNLERNLKKHKVSQSTAQKVLKYDSQYREKLVKKGKLHKKKLEKRVKSEQKSTRVSQTMTSNNSYFLQIINFSYKQVNEDEIDYFIKTINKNKKVLSDTLIRKIIWTYKHTLNKSTNKKQRKKLINDELENNLLRKGVHPDTIKLILQLDSNYNN